MRHILIDWQFNTGAWAAAMRDAVELVGEDVIAGVMECHINTVRGWCRMTNGYDKFPYPNMTNFIKFCNHVDRDPRDFFILEDK